jgi:hypothetical protein
MLTYSPIRVESAFPTTPTSAWTFIGYDDNTVAVGAAVKGVGMTDSDEMYGVPIMTAGYALVQIAAGQTLAIGNQVEAAAGGLAALHTAGTSTGIPAGRVVDTDGTYVKVQLATGN